jgi:hypothetical protein
MKFLCIFLNVCWRGGSIQKLSVVLIFVVQKLNYTLLNLLKSYTNNSCSNWIYKSLIVYYLFVENEIKLHHNQPGSSINSENGLTM